METQAHQSTFEDGKEQFTTATLIHLSTLSKYFFPFANFIAPILIWTYNKEKPFVDEHGRQAINFQLSMLIYTLIIGLACIPLIVFFAGNFISIMESVDRHGGSFSINNIQNLSGYVLLFGIFLLMLMALFVFELYAVINAAIHASRGQLYQYPLSIAFIKTNVNKNHSK